MSKLFTELKRDPRLANEIVTRPHPLLLAASREDLMVIVAPAAVWERGRDLLKPFAQRFADGEQRRYHVAIEPAGMSEKLPNREHCEDNRDTQQRNGADQRFRRHGPCQSIGRSHRSAFSRVMKNKTLTRITKQIAA